jgi:hypothetical protein
MQNLRVTNVNTTSSTSIDITFTLPITKNLTTSNVSITANNTNYSNPQVLSVSVSNNTLTVICQPLIEFAIYFVTCISTTQNPFISLNGQAFLLQDNVANKSLITGPINPSNPVQNYLTTFLADSIYEVNDPTTNVSNFIQSLSINLSRALYDIGQLKNENYLSLDIVDERKIRGAGSSDRLDEEGAYEILRVGLTPSGTNANFTLQYSNFPYYPVSLQQVSYSDTLYPSSVDTPGNFNINSLTLNLTQSPVIQLTSVIFYLYSSPTPYVYNIETLGYKLKNPRYDENYATLYTQLLDNQARLNSSILSDSSFDLNNITQVVVQYNYKNLGRIVDSSSLDIYTVLTSSREVIPPIINIFTLSHAPITDSNGNTITLNGVTWINPNSNTGAPHPAFLYEIVFNLSNLPYSPGQYSVDYSTGTVYVFGASLSNDGTGPYPPLATYYYTYSYVSEIDYVYDLDLLDLVSLPNGSLRNYPCIIKYNYEDTLAPGTDYNSDVHIEVLDEYVNNNLYALNAIKTQNFPITNVFRIFNQSSGEIYTLNRWFNNIIYFNYNNPPRINEQTAERASFNNVVSELLLINSSSINQHGLRIITVYLNNNTIIASTEDSTASFLNSSLIFSNKNIFSVERYFDNESRATSRLQNIGEYCVDYLNGVIYCAVLMDQDFDIGTCSYKNNNIIPKNSHLITVSDIYYQISSSSIKNKEFPYISFGDNYIIPNSLDQSMELYLNNLNSAPYQIYNTNIGIYAEAGGFVAGVTYQVKYVRGVYEYQDLINSTKPLNFASNSVSSGFNITVNSLSSQFFDYVRYDGVNYYVIINQNIPYISPNITYTFSVIRISDNQQLWDQYGTIVPGSPIILILSPIGLPAYRDLVNISYTFTINNNSVVGVDYNKGDFYIDYTYLFDEIVVSYEYGDNIIDFSSSNSIPVNTEYFASYRVGALRDALLANFANLINIPELTNFDINFERERYRDAIFAALSSFIQGPTVAAIKNIGKIISHTEPEVIESVFSGWSLGNSLLNPQPVLTEGTFNLLPAKYNLGVLIDQPSQLVKLPIDSNFRFEEGTLETWLIPQWNGLDNNSNLCFNILKNNVVVNSNFIYVGAAALHPTIVDNKFYVRKSEIAIGTPNKNRNGIFIYYDEDPSNNFYKFYVEIIDNNILNSVYTINLNSDGVFYDVKSLTYPKPSNLSTFTGLNKIKLTLTGQNLPVDGYGITFLSDFEHYLFDFGEEEDKNRFSIFKDVSGYLNLRVFDKNNTSYNISHNISDWKSGDSHFIAASWKLNTVNSQDELHLFIDGFEVPNNLVYGQQLKPYCKEKFRTIDPEVIIGFINRDILSSNDLVTIKGSNVVSSATNFSAYSIYVGDLIYIEESGFSSSGYSITNINGQSLTLNTPMPLSITGGDFCVNKKSLHIKSEIDIYSNISVSTLSTLIYDNDLSGTIGTNTVSSAHNNFSTLGIPVGSLIKIDGYQTLFLTITSVINHNLILSENLEYSFNNVPFYIYSTPQEIPGLRALRPAYSISKDGYNNNVITLYDDVKANDLILIDTYGLNFRRIRGDSYVWAPDGYQNILMSALPSPISLDDTKIFKYILPKTLIGPSNGILTSYGIFESNLINGTNPTDNIYGRTLSATISGRSDGYFCTQNKDNNYDGYYLDGYYFDLHYNKWYHKYYYPGHPDGYYYEGISSDINFAVPTYVSIYGYTKDGYINETLLFNEFKTIDFSNLYTYIDQIVVYTKPSHKNVYNNTYVKKNILSVEIKEKYSLLNSQNPDLTASKPVIRYSYYMGGGYNLYSNDGYTLTDGYNYFSELDIGNYLLITSPSTVAGFYTITGVSSDLQSLYIQTTPDGYPLPLTPFTNGKYKILNTTDYRSGLQNGLFTFEESQRPGNPYYLPQGLYNLDYYTYAKISVLPPSNTYMYIGSDYNSEQQISGILNQFKIYSMMLTDTRVGEVIPTSQTSITKDYNLLKPSEIDQTVLTQITFNNLPFTNSAEFYVTPNNAEFPHFQSSVVVNSNFVNSITILDKPIIIDNSGILNTKSQGTIEFWVSPLYETANDPNYRYYFDASGIVVENAVSINSNSVILPSPANKIISVVLQNGDPNIDYFAGGKLEISTQRAISEIQPNLPNNSVKVNSPILQVISVMIVGDLSYFNYFSSGSTVASDNHTIYLATSLPLGNLELNVVYKSTLNNNTQLNTQIIRLGRELPAQNVGVIVKYLPSGVQGDRLSIYKDKSGYMNFRILASGSSYVVRAPTRWARNTWHRIKASYKVNSNILNNDEMRLFVDGYEYSNILYGSGINYGSYPYVYGSTIVGSLNTLTGNINFKDTVNTLYIGSEVTNNSPAFCLIDNFRISNISRPIYTPYGEPIDVNYSSNLNTVFPVTKDLYTTLLLDFNKTTYLNTDFANIVNRITGGFDFSVNIFDSFDIVSSSPIVKNCLEKLINVLKPANSKVYINYEE